MLAVIRTSRARPDLMAYGRWAPNLTAGAAKILEVPAAVAYGPRERAVATPHSPNGCGPDGRMPAAEYRKLYSPVPTIGSLITSGGISLFLR